MYFTKMHGLGNDYIYVNGITEHIREPERLAVRLSDRHFGVGADGLILILPSRRADFRMEIDPELKCAAMESVALQSMSMTED